MNGLKVDENIGPNTSNTIVQAATTMATRVEIEEKNAHSNISSCIMVDTEVEVESVKTLDSDNFRLEPERTGELSGLKRGEIDTLRSGGEVNVKNYDEDRELLDNMPELKTATENGKLPNVAGRRRDGFADPKGTYRGDLINKQNPTAPVHLGVGNPKHPNHPHYNIKLPNGDKTAIIIKGD